MCWRDQITNDETLQRLGQVGVLEVVKKRQEEWKERLQGMDNDRCTRECSKVLWKAKGSEVDLSNDGWKISASTYGANLFLFMSTLFNGLGSCT